MNEIIIDPNCNPNACTWPNCACKHEPVEIAPDFVSTKVVIISFVLAFLIFTGLVLWALEITKP